MSNSSDCGRLAFLFVYFPQGLLRVSAVSFSFSLFAVLSVCTIVFSPPRFARLGGFVFSYFIEVFFVIKKMHTRRINIPPRKVYAEAF